MNRYNKLYSSITLLLYSIIIATIPSNSIADSALLEKLKWDFNDTKRKLTDLGNSDLNSINTEKLNPVLYLPVVIGAFVAAIALVMILIMWLKKK